jgi:alanyl-tRNA synthetase
MYVCMCVCVCVCVCSADITRSVLFHSCRLQDRGERIFQSEAAGLEKGGVFAGDVAWKLYDTYGFPIDLTKVMAEERGLKVDMTAYEKAKQIAREISGNTESRKEEVTLSVHQISALSERNVPATDDSAKFNYDLSKDGSYVFHNITARVVALVADGNFVEAVAAGSTAQVGVVLDRTNFYAEMGGQVADTGLMLNNATDTDFVVQNVKKCGPFALHIGVLQSGELKVGSELTLDYHSEVR